MTPQRTTARLPLSHIHGEYSLLLQFVLLSMLLHLLVVLLFGTATVGGARRGDGWLGPLDVTLRSLSPERGAGFTLAPGSDAPLPGAALLRRVEGAAKLPVAKPEPPAPAATPPPAEVRDAVPDISLTPRPVPADAVPRLDRSAPEEVDKPLVAPAITPPRVAPPPAEKEPPPRDFTLPPMAPLERIVPPKLERQLAPPIELRPREVPVAPREPPVEFKPQEETAPAPAPIEKPEPAKIEREALPPVEPKPRDVAPPPVAPVERVAPPAPVPAPAPAREAASVVQAPARIAPADVVPAGVPGKPPAARTEAPAGGERIRFGAPSAEDEIFGTKRDAQEAGAPPAVTVESMKKRAREIAAEGSGSRGVLNLVPPPPPVERRDKLAEDIAKAAKPDCRTAYAGLGILAVVPLVASSVSSNGGCNW